MSRLSKESFGSLSGSDSSSLRTYSSIRTVFFYLVVLPDRLRGHDDARNVPKVAPDSLLLLEVFERLVISRVCLVEG